MDNVTYIIPVLKLGTKEEKKALKDTLESVKKVLRPDDAVIIAGNEKITSQKLEEGASYTTLPTSADSVYAIVNEAVMLCTTEYFSIVEPGETYRPYWPESAKLYNKNYSVLLPLIQNVSENEKPFLSNELAWSALFTEEDTSNEIGFITLSFLEKFFDFAISGAYINTEDFISIGKFKPSLKIATWYEFLLRCAYKAKKIYVVPKVGLVRPVVGPDEEISREEVDWLIKTAQQEYFFTEDRGKKFGED